MQRVTAHILRLRVRRVLTEAGGGQGRGKPAQGCQEEPEQEQAEEKGQEPAEASRHGRPRHGGCGPRGGNGRNRCRGFGLGGRRLAHEPEAHDVLGCRSGCARMKAPVDEHGLSVNEINVVQGRRVLESEAQKFRAGGGDAAAARFGLAFEQGADCAAVARQGGADPALFLFRKLGELSGFAAEVCVPVYGSAPGIVDRFGQKRSRVRHAVRGEKVPVPFEQGAQLIVAVGGQHALEGQGAHVVASAGGEKNAHRIPPRPGAFPALRGALAVMDHTRSWFCRQTAFHGPHTEKNAGIR